MKNVFFLVALTISIFVLMSFSSKYKWNSKLWGAIDHKNNFGIRLVLWLIIIILIQVLIEYIAKEVRILENVHQVIQGIVWGFDIAVFPNKDEKEE